jgi:thiol:disulfide interchange protein DsbD
MRKAISASFVLGLFFLFATHTSFADPGITEGLAKATKAVEKGVSKPAKVVKKAFKKVKSLSPWEKIKSFFSLEHWILAKLPLIYVLVIAFLIGIAVSFTPCIYPMIPITMGILQSQATPSVGRNFLLSTSYVTGIAVVYAILGYFAATTSLVLGQWLANPFLIALVILLFLYLAFSMFGFYEIYIPRFLQKGTQVKVKGSFLYSFLFGAVSGTVASPCISPAIAILLGYVAKRGNPVIGFLTLFTFAFGMGLLLIFVGTFSASVEKLPRAGKWMVEIKKFFGFLLLGVCIYFLQPFIRGGTATFLYLTLTAITIGYYGFVIFKAFKNKKQIEQQPPI